MAASIIAITANIFVILAAVMGVFQLIQIRKSNELQEKSILADHERRKKQSTIEYYSSIYNVLGKLRQEIIDLSGGRYINPQDDNYIKNIQLQKAVSEYLIIMERFAVGINSDVYDIHIFARASGKVVCDMYKRLQPIIEYIRYSEAYPQAYNDYEKMVGNILIIRSRLYPVPAGEDHAPVKYS